MKLKSEIRVGGTVEFPEFTGERLYMIPFFQADALPPELSRWQKTVDVMLKGIVTEKPIYLMIDQGVVEPGTTHRRGGLHVDGNWVANPNYDYKARSGPEAFPGLHPAPEPDPEPTHRHPVPVPPTHKHMAYSPETLIFASNIAASRAIVGEFDGVPGPDGGCDHLNVQSGKEVLLEAGKVYRGNVTMVHESLPVPVRCQRTLVRLNIPGLELGCN